MSAGPAAGSGASFVGAVPDLTSHVPQSPRAPSRQPSAAQRRVDQAVALPARPRSGTLET